MKTKVVTKGSLSYILVKNFFDKKVLSEVYDELDRIKPFTKEPDACESATENGEILKTGSGVFVDGLYPNNRESSPILLNCRRLFNNPEIGKKATSKNAVFGHIDKSLKDFTLVNFYTSGQEYKTHADNAAITALTFLKIGNFTGGDFIFPEHDELIPFEENTMVIFPGCVPHRAMPISGNKDSYRVSIAQFLNYT